MYQSLNQVNFRLKSIGDLKMSQFFELEFSNYFCKCLVIFWNENIGKFNFEESCKLLALISNIAKHTVIFSASGSNKAVLLNMTEAIQFLLEAAFINRFSPILKNIISNFWKDENFEFPANQIVCSSFVDIMKSMNDLNDKLATLDSSNAKTVMHRVITQ